MGCCGSRSQLAVGEYDHDIAASQSSVESGASKELMHTNSMLFPKDAIEEAKRSLRLQRPVDDTGVAALLLEHDDPEGVLMSSDPLFELGMEIEYPVEMSEPMTLNLLKRKKSAVGKGKKAFQEIHEDAAEVTDVDSDADDDHESSDGAGTTPGSPKAPAAPAPRVTLDDYEKGHKLIFGYKSIQGRSAAPPSKPNQDSVVAFVVDGKPNQAVFGVFDGHGPFGEHASHFCRMELHKTIKAIYEEFGDDTPPEDVLERSIARLHQAFIDTDPSYSGVDPQVSGTTLVVAMIVDSKVYVANVGDSRCILGEKVHGSSSGKVLEMSDDHKPERESERKRIDATDAVLMSEGQLRGGKRSEGKTYICRRRNGDIVYGVLFTRSVGDADAHEHLGVSAEPEFKQARIRSNVVQYLVIASDGIWDQMTNEQVLTKVFATKNPLFAAEKIAEIARELWDTDRMHSRRDDITVCVVQLE